MTVSLAVSGMVQGVGFRPFVARLAEEMGMTGTVCNSGGTVEIIVTGNQGAVDGFIHRLWHESPPGAQVLDIQATAWPAQQFAGFNIIESDPAVLAVPIVPADLPTCEDCLHELSDQENRRYAYPFISCTACGPRYSIIERLPYDRETTTMEDFPMCEKCTEEYLGNHRRRHAQTISCHDCGPQLILREGMVECTKEQALERAVALLNGDAILSVKGVGGYQFVCTPYSQESIGKLRQLKCRDKKPFAIMFPNLEMVQEYCSMNREEEMLLTSPARPIVLLEKRKDEFAGNVSSESRLLGAFLPYTTLHQLLLDACGPLIVTSANRSSQPMITQDEEMSALASSYLDGVLYNTRRIVVPLDDSVTQVIAGRPQLLRRSRGYVPLPIMVENNSPKALFAAGGDLKACFALMAGNRVYPSQYFGDMEDLGIARVYEDNLHHMENLLHIQPEAVVCDLHPAYRSASLARAVAQREGLTLFEVQHHHAHIASVMAEHELSGCIGVAFDGTGYGTDGTVWGGEFLLCEGAAFERMGHLDRVQLLGGDAAAKDASLNAMCHSHAFGMACKDDRFETVCSAIENGINTETNTSIGRLFDAVSALLGLRWYNSYEGECAIALENAAAQALKAGMEPYPLRFEIAEQNGRLMASREELIRTVMESEAEKGALALGFHFAVAEMAAEMCRRIRMYTQQNCVALSGGVFANRILTERCIELLEEDGFNVYLNTAVPCNDGGISLGQAWVASLLMREGAF